MDSSILAFQTREPRTRNRWQMVAEGLTKGSMLHMDKGGETVKGLSQMQVGEQIWRTENLNGEESSGGGHLCRGAR